MNAHEAHLQVVLEHFNVVSAKLLKAETKIKSLENDVGFWKQAYGQHNQGSLAISDSYQLTSNIEYLMGSRRSMLCRLDAIEAKEKATDQVGLYPTKKMRSICLEQLCRSFVKDLERTLGYDRKETES